MSRGLWIPDEILNDRRFTPMEKLFLAEIIQLDKAKGCYALNAHFADRFGIGKSRASQIISGLSVKGSVRCSLQRNGKQVTGRTITPLGNLTGVCRKPKEGIEENDKPPLGKREDNKQGNKQGNEHAGGICCVEFLTYWNSHGNLPKIVTFTEHRKRTLATRSKEPEFANKWKLIVDKLSRSPFHIGQNNRKWRATVDWLLKNDTNYVKILELENTLANYGTREVSEAEATELMAEVSGDS